MKNDFESNPDIENLFKVNEDSIPDKLIKISEKDRHKITEPILTAAKIDKNGKIKKNNKNSRKRKLMKRRLYMAGASVLIILIIFGILRFLIADAGKPEVTVQKAQIGDISRYYTDSAAVFKDGNSSFAVLIDNDYDVHFIEAGQKADVYLTNGQSLSGTVSEIKEEKPNSATLSSIMELFGWSTAPETSSYGVYISFDDPNGLLQNGERTSVKIYTKTAEKAVLIPSQAIRTADSTSFVWVFDQKKGVINRKDIVSGITSDGQTEIIKGLSKGDAVVVTATCDYSELYDGMKVR